LEFCHKDGIWREVGSGGGESTAEIQYTWQVNGAIVPGIAIDLPRSVDLAGTVAALYVSAGNTGTGGDDLEIDIFKNGTSIYAGGGSRPVIGAATGDDQLAISTDMDTTSAVVGNRYALNVLSAPTGAENLSVSLIVNIPVPMQNETPREMQWQINGAVAPGKFDGARHIRQAGVIDRYTCTLHQTGTSGDDTDIALLVNGEDVFRGSGDPLNIPPNSTNPTVSSTIDFGEYAYFVGESVIEAKVLSAADDATDLECVARVRSPTPQYTVYVWRVSGVLLAGQNIDLKRYVPRASVIRSVSVLLEDSGSSGELAINVRANGDALTDDPLILAANTHHPQRLFADADFTTRLIAPDSWLSVDFEAVADESQDVVVQVVVQTLQ